MSSSKEDAQFQINTRNSFLYLTIILLKMFMFRKIVIIFELESSRFTFRRGFFQTFIPKNSNVVCAQM